MLPLFAVADAAPAHHQPLERLLTNGDHDDTGSGDQVPPWWQAIMPDCHAHAVPAETHTLRVCTVLNSIFFGWSLAAITLESSMQRQPLAHLPAVMTHTEVAVCVCVYICVCVCVCPSTEPSHAEEWTEWWHTLAASYHDLIHSERDRKIERQNGKMPVAKMTRVCACVLYRDLTLWCGGWLVRWGYLRLCHQSLVKNKNIVCIFILASLHFTVVFIGFPVHVYI